MSDTNNSGLAGELIKAFRKCKSVPQIAKQLGLPESTVQVEFDAWRRTQAKIERKKSVWHNDPLVIG